MLNLLDLKSVLKIFLIGLVVGCLFFCYHYYTLSVEQTKQIKQLEKIVDEKQALIKKLRDDINEKIADFQALNTQFSDIENKYKEKISTLLNQMKPSENSAQENEILIGIFNQTLSEISTISGGSK